MAIYFMILFVLSTYLCVIVNSCLLELERSCCKDSEIWTELGGFGPFIPPPRTDSVREHRLEVYQDLVLDGQLSNEEFSESSAYQALMEEKLYPAYLQAMWVDEPNYNVISSRWYTLHLPVFYGMYYVGRMKHWAQSYLRKIYCGDLVTKEDIEYAVTKEATKCINMLSAKLGDKKFLFGDRPSSVDAVAFGYLAPLLKLPFPNDKLAEAIKACPNLVRHVDSIINVYMPLTINEKQKQIKNLKTWESHRDEARKQMNRKPRSADSTSPRHADSDKTGKGDSDDEYPLRDKIVFGVGAAVLMLIFAVHFGIIQVDVKEMPVEESRVPALPEPLLEIETEV